jgi:hypothetical protein
MPPFLNVLPERVVHVGMEHAVIVRMERAQPALLAAAQQKQFIRKVHTMECTSTSFTMRTVPHI